MRAIDADKLIAELEYLKTNDPYRKQRGLVERWVRSYGYEILIRLARRFTRVDVEEVVYCKDCVHCEMDMFYKGAYCKRNIDKGMVLRFEENGFCSYGRRKHEVN